ncbi:MAG: hypothetical protein QOE28_3043, partial [Solirubrobacteraceae bacterium]|nr:hypothetical protein [Solirubrobacteraceae bacterium]
MTAAASDTSRADGPAPSPAGPRVAVLACGALAADVRRIARARGF